MSQNQIHSQTHQSFRDVSCPNCGSKLVGKSSDSCPKCGSTGMVVKSEDELTKKVVSDSDLYK